MKIYLDRRLGDVHDLISFSETLVCVQEYYPDAVDYRPEARLPVDFRKLDEFEVNKYTASLDELSIEDELDFVAIFPCDQQSEQALDFSPFLSLSPVAALDPSIDDGDRPSITVDRVSGLRLGLHLDSWDGLEVSSRWKSRNRIVVNRGPADRYVYLVPVPIEEMAESVASPEDLHPGEVADAYVRNTGRAPCLRMLQPANVAYVCCTERLVHDACVRAGGIRAESRHYLGHFVRN
ncbi:MAG: hypothetical protein OXJ63_09775 [Gammaproteobacteria bacterium]|nr:hypothetical protein [Gammaproteobacteria bacterium]